MYVNVTHRTLACSISHSENKFETIAAGIDIRRPILQGLCHSGLLGVTAYIMNNNFIIIVVIVYILLSVIVHIRSHAL